MIALSCHRLVLRIECCEELTVAVGVGIFRQEHALEIAVVAYAVMYDGRVGF